MLLKKSLRHSKLSKVLCIPFTYGDSDWKVPRANCWQRSALAFGTGLVPLLITGDRRRFLRPGLVVELQLPSVGPRRREAKF